jgi:hypothetical protein
MSVIDDPQHPAVDRLRKRGPSLAAAVVLFSLAGIPGAVLVPGAVSMVLVVLMAFGLRDMGVEWRWERAAGRAEAGDRRLVGCALIVGLIGGFFSLVAEEWASLPALCGPMPVPGGDLPAECLVMTSAESAGLGVWTGTIAMTAALFIVCAVLTRRSWIAGWLVIPFVVAGCVIAFDLGHAVADAVGRA